MVLNQKKVRLIYDETSTRKHYPSTGIYLAISKVAQFRPMSDNRREREEKKKETAKNTATQKLHLQQKRCTDFQKFQDSMNSILSSPTVE